MKYIKENLKFKNFVIYPKPKFVKEFGPCKKFEWVREETDPWGEFPRPTSEVLFHSYVYNIYETTKRKSSFTHLDNIVGYKITAEYSENTNLVWIYLVTREKYYSNMSFVITAPKLPYSTDDEMLEHATANKQVIVDNIFKALKIKDWSELTLETLCEYENSYKIHYCK